MMKFFLLLVLSASFAFASPREEAQALLDTVATETDTVRRLDLLSRAFLGLPYGEGGPLGEGPQGRYDQDPLYRFDTFDCTTFVETVVGLATSREASEFEARMDEIRYENGHVDYLTRNHYTSLQWVPNNVANGLLSEINDVVLPRSQQLLAEAEIDLPGWLRAMKLPEIKVPLATTEERQALLDELHALSANYSPRMARIWYVPIATLLADPKLLDRVPSGSIVNWVRPNWDLTATAGTHLNVSHQGLLFRKGRVLYLRHASTMHGKIVFELPLIEYLEMFRNHPTLKGLHLMKVN